MPSSNLVDWRLSLVVSRENRRNKPQQIMSSKKTRILVINWGTKNSIKDIIHIRIVSIVTISTQTNITSPAHGIETYIHNVSKTIPHVKKQCSGDSTHYVCRWNPLHHFRFPRQKERIERGREWKRVVWLTAGNELRFILIIISWVLCHGSANGPSS